jgi:hypothetical protein
MSDFTIIADASEALRQLLFREMSTGPALVSDVGQISLASPKELEESADGGGVKLSVFLYRVLEDATARNRPGVPGNGSSLRRPPMAVDLHYLVTPLFDQAITQQQVLGRVIQVLADHSTIELPSTDLGDPLATRGEVLRVVLNPVSLEEIARVWQALEMSFRLSVCYVVRVALLDSRVEEFTQPVVQSDFVNHGKRLGHAVRA